MIKKKILVFYYDNKNSLIRKTMNITFRSTFNYLYFCAKYQIATMTYSDGSKVIVCYK